MSEWKEYKLGDIAEIIGGGTPDTSKREYWGGDIPWLTPKDLTGYNKIFISKGERSITEEGLKNSSTKLLPKGTVLLSSRAPIGYVAIASNPICTNQGFKSIVCNPDIIDNKYMYYWIKNNTEMLQSLGTGTTFAEISGSVVKSIDILLPPLDEQKRIASILSSLDDKIDLLHRENATLEAMAETIFRHWFIEEAKENWEEVLITDLFEVKDGTHDSPKPQDFGYKLITSKYIRNNLIDFDGAYNISEQDYIAINKRSKVETGDILFSMIGTIGLIYLEQNNEINYAIKNVGLIKTSQNKLWKYFVYLWFKSEFGEEWIFENTTGSTQEYISLASLRNIKFRIKSIVQVEEFNQKVKNCFSKIKINQEQMCVLNQMKNDLLNKLMSNEIKL